MQTIIEITYGVGFIFLLMVVARQARLAYRRSPPPHDLLEAILLALLTILMATIWPVVAVGALAVLLAWPLIWWIRS